MRYVALLPDEFANFIELSRIQELGDSGLCRVKWLRYADNSESLFGFIVQVSEELPVPVVWVNI